MNELDILDELKEDIDTFIERWNKIQRNSMKAIQAVTNTLVQIEHLEGSIGKLEDFHNIRENTKGKLLVMLYDSLVPSLEASIKEFTKLMKMFEQLRQKVSTLQTFTESLRDSVTDSPEMEDMVGFLELIVLTINDILNMYEAEFLVKITIYRDFEEGDVEIGVVSNYLTIWSTEPNIEQNVLEKLLKDLTEHFELLRDVFSGKTGIRLPDLSRRASL